MTKVTGLDGIQTAVGKHIVTDAHAEDIRIRAEKVKRYREYVDNEHDFSWLSEEQRTLLNLKVGDEFSVNHCENILNSFADRLNISNLEGENEASNKWLTDLLDWNDFDQLQLDVHENCPADGDTYIMIGFDSEAQRAVMTHELAYDGIEGMTVIYKRGGSDELLCALKVWQEVVDAQTTRTRLNVYYEDRIEKFASNNGGNFEYYDQEGSDAQLVVEGENGRQFIPWIFEDGTPIGVPVVPFKNGKRGKGGFGISILENAIPLQNAMNRSLHSLIGAEDLSAFQIRYSIGVAAPKKIAPGVIIEVVPKTADGKPAPIDEKTAAWLNAIRLGAIEQGELAPHIDTLKFERAQIYEVTGTPDYGAASDLSSGESLKQREIRLLSRVEKAQVRLGGAWKMVLYLAHRVTQAFADQLPPENKIWRVRWKDAQIRNDTEVVNNANTVAPKIPTKEWMRLVAPVFGWDEAKIEEMHKALTQDRQVQLALALGAAGNPPNFSSFNGANNQQNGGGNDQSN